MIKLLLIVTCFMVTHMAFTQRNPGNKTVLNSENTLQNNIAIGSNYSTSVLAAPGTYQILLVDAAHQFAVNDEYLLWLESTRKNDEDQHIQVNEYITVYLPSKNTINQKDFLFLAPILIKEH